ncbi:MAG: hypothetical protein NT028_08390 [candidate division Zixibacteria bacterium]|nr:hypothetical protein [candidate division Zixibacteria bacterium]
MRKIMSKQLAAFLIITLALLVLGLVALQAQDSTKVMAPAQPQPLSPEEFQKVIHSTNPQDWMAIQAMTDDQVKAIMNSKVLVLRLGAVVEEWQALFLNGLTYITDDQAKLLAKNEVNLSLDGLKSLTDEQAKSFSTYKGKFMPRAYAIKALTDKQAKALAQFQGKIAGVALDKASRDLFLKYGGSLLGEE